jgi:hypothetical protein
MVEGSLERFNCGSEWGGRCGEVKRYKPGGMSRGEVHGLALQMDLKTFR